jgi:spermidine synthase
VILATFLGGLSGGYYLCGKLTTKVRNQFKAYALLEGIIAVWGFFFPVIFETVDSATRSWSFSPPVLIILQGLFCSALLMGIPTVCMGGTIPFLTRGIAQSVEEATRVHAKVYGINTAGAFLGTLAAGFFMIPSLGLPLTVMYTALLNLSAALFFFLFSSIKFKATDDAVSQVSVDGEQVALSVGPPAFRYSPLVLYTVAFMSGFYVMTLENVLIRIISLCLGSSSYSFAMIVSVFVLAIAIGSYVVGKVNRLPHNLLFFNQFLIALFLMLLYISLDTWPYWAHLIRISIQSHIAGFWVYYGNVFIVLTLVLILPVSLMGATVPITFHEIKRDLANVGRHSGLLFSWNTIGNLIGSLVGGIILFSAFNLSGIFSITVFLAALSTCLVAWKLPKKYFTVAAILTAGVSGFVVTTPFYNVSHFVIGAFRIRSPQSFSMGGLDGFFKGQMENRILRFYKDGSSASVAVVEHRQLEDIQPNEQNPLAIYINGKSDSSTFVDISTLKLSAHLPALLASERRTVMVIGLGTGVTAGELTLYPDIERIDIAEISPEVVETLPYFAKANHNVHQNSKVKIHIGDAFRILGRSKNKWDMIISEPSNPWVTGVDLLFTKEFYALVKERLSADGILLQWVQVYDANVHMVGMIVNTVMQAFRQCHVFMANEGDLLIVATDKEFVKEDLERAENLLQTNETVRASLDFIHLSSLDALLLRQLWSTSHVRDFFSDSGIQTMDHPRLHYMAGKMFFMGATMPRSVLLGATPIPHLSEYLMTKRHPEWANFKLEVDTFKSFMESARERASGHDLLMVPAIKLKAYLYDSRMFSLTEQEKQFFKVDLIPLITGKAKGEGAWTKVGLKRASYRRKAEVMLSHIDQHRNWIVPYPIDGLKALLKEGILNGADVYEKNWCALHLVFLLTYERADMSQIKPVFASLETDKDGRVLLKKEDEALWRHVEGQLKKVSVQK